MPIDMGFFRGLSVEEQKAWKQKLEYALTEVQEKLIAIEIKVKEAVSGDTKPSDLSVLLAYRDEVKKELNQIRSDLDQIERFNKNEEFLKPDPVSIATSVGGTGVVQVRGNSSQFRKVPGTKTYQEILDKKKKDDEAEKEIKEIAKKILDEYKKVEYSKKRTESSKETSKQ